MNEMNNLRLRPYYPIPIVRDTKALVIPNKSGWNIYRPAAKLPKSKLSPHYKAKIYIPREQDYKRKSHKLKIYQLSHDEASLGISIDNKYVSRFSLDRSFKTKDKTIEILGDVKHKTNQISESRAFLHHAQYGPKIKYVGFTSHKHDRKFFRKDRAITLSEIDLDIVDRAMTGCPNVKFIGFRVHPAHDFIKGVDIAGSNGTEEFLYGFFKDCYHFDRESYDNLLESMRGKILPYCNCFITHDKEIRQYAAFMLSFLDWADDKCGFDKQLINVRKGHRSYDVSKEWGYICEQLIWYYIAFKYKKNFTIAFIDENHHISYHDRIGYGIHG